MQVSFIIIVAALLITSTAIFNNIKVGNAQQDKEEIKQIFISNDNIKKVNSVGDYKGEKHVKYYTPNKLFDNLTNSYSFWSQNGDSSFSIELKKPLKNPVCSIDIGVFEPQLKTPFTIKVSNSTAFKQASGILDQPNKNASIDKCISNVNKIEMSFKPTSNVVKDRWTILSEIKLFTDESIIIPPVDPPICKQGEHVENGICVPDIVTPPPIPIQDVNGSISNSNVTLTVSNSTVTIIGDEKSSIVTPQVISPEDIATGDPNDKSDEKEEEEEREEQEEQEEEEENDDSSNNEKDKKKGEDN